MPVLHYLCGLPGSGKSTFAKRLQQRFTGAQLYTPDLIMNQRHGSDPEKGLFAREYDKVVKDVWIMAETTINDGHDVIFDFGFWTRASRDQARRKAKTLRVDYQMYWLRTAPDECLKRVLCRNRDLPPNSLWIDENAFKLFHAQFQPPQSDEVVTVIDGDYRAE